MINYKALAETRKKFSQKDAPFLFESTEKLIKEKPYKDLKILHNIPLTLGTVIKIEALLLGGADVTVTSVKSVKPHQDAINVLKRAGIELKLKRELTRQHYDIHLDCCAELASMSKPRIGTVELTQTGTHFYKNNNQSYPVISVDDCKLKSLEGIGTGDGFVRAIQELTKQSINDKRFIVFGYGKIGRGIANALQKYTSNIVVVEKNERLLNEINTFGYTAVSITNKTSIQHSLQDAFCAVTATGVPACISLYFEKSDFKGVYLANMGATDEFGYKFSTKDILFAKKPINFAITEPTKLHYLDPIFFAHNNAIDLFLSKEVNDCYSPYPEILSNTIMKKWLDFHSENINMTAHG